MASRTVYTARSAEAGSTNRLAFSVYKTEKMRTYGLSMGVFSGEEATKPPFSTPITRHFVEMMRLIFERLIGSSPGTTVNCQIEEKQEDGKYAATTALVFGIDEHSVLYIHVQNKDVNTRFLIRGDLKFNFSSSGLPKQVENKAAVNRMMVALTQEAIAYGIALEAGPATATTGAGEAAAEGGDKPAWQNRQGGGNYQPRQGGGNWQNRQGGGGNYQNRQGGGGNWQNRQGGGGGNYQGGQNRGNWNNNKGGSQGGGNYQPRQTQPAQSDAELGDGITF